ncbi:COMM domain-containing protein 4 [Lethenteron reissneri]|uniref:COMM domain-containing protein 4 n=1 Tax=Lethenteron reissneri TaxID=7753 RepID=UPI002AB7BD87|nr:COMM domain-containing protein 4 [Lethenteron reissneri]
MRFRFSGDRDCPDWVLAEISTLTKLTSVKMKLLCVQMIKDLLGEPIDYQKITKLTEDAKFESGDVKASLAVLEFVLCSAAKYNVDGNSLSSELQQLGLPKEHASALCKVYEDKQAELQDQLKSQSLRLSRLAGVSWRVDYTLCSSELAEVNEPSVQLRLNIQDGATGIINPIAFTLSDSKLRVLLTELKTAQQQMSELS